MIVARKKERLWGKKRNNRREDQREKINNLRRQKQADQGEKQQVGGLIA